MNEDGYKRMVQFLGYLKARQRKGNRFDEPVVPPVSPVAQADATRVAKPVSLVPVDDYSYLEELRMKERLRNTKNPIEKAALLRALRIPSTVDPTPPDPYYLLTDSEYREMAKNKFMVENQHLWNLASSDRVTPENVALIAAKQKPLADVINTALTATGGYAGLVKAPYTTAAGLAGGIASGYAADKYLPESPSKPAFTLLAGMAGGIATGGVTYKYTKNPATVEPYNDSNIPKEFVKEIVAKKSREEHNSLLEGLGKKKTKRELKKRDKIYNTTYSNTGKVIRDVPRGNLFNIEYKKQNRNDPSKYADIEISSENPIADLNNIKKPKLNYYTEKYISDDATGTTQHEMYHYADGIELNKGNDKYINEFTKNQIPYEDWKKSFVNNGKSDFSLRIDYDYISDPREAHAYLGNYKESLVKRKLIKSMNSKVTDEVLYNAFESDTNAEMMVTNLFKPDHLKKLLNMISYLSIVPPLIKEKEK
jgi:hypothetical protein